MTDEQALQLKELLLPIIRFRIEQGLDYDDIKHSFFHWEHEYERAKSRYKDPANLQYLERYQREMKRKGIDPSKSIYEVFPEEL